MAGAAGALEAVQATSPATSYAKIECVVPPSWQVTPSAGNESTFPVQLFWLCETETVALGQLVAPVAQEQAHVPEPSSSNTRPAATG